MTIVKEHFANPFQKKMRPLHPVFYILLKGKVKIGPSKIHLMEVFPVAYFHRLLPMTSLS